MIASPVFAEPADIDGEPDGDSEADEAGDAEPDGDAESDGDAEPDGDSESDGFGSGLVLHPENTEMAIRITRRTARNLFITHQSFKLQFWITRLKTEIDTTCHNQHKMTRPQYAFDGQYKGFLFFLILLGTPEYS